MHRRDALDLNAEDGYEWICKYLDTCEGDLLEFELDVDAQHFFDGLELPSTTSSPTPPSNEYSEFMPQLPPFLPSKNAIADSKPISYCALLEEAQLTAQCTEEPPQVENPAKRQALTSPRKLRARSQKKIAATLQLESPFTNSTRRMTRSSSRQINRRLFH